MKKPTWVIDKERAKRASAAETVWLFGLHAVRDALMNPAREKLRLGLHILLREGSTERNLEHLLPLMVASGAGGEAPGACSFYDEPMEAAISAFRFDGE